MDGLQNTLSRLNVPGRGSKSNAEAFHGFAAGDTLLAQVFFWGDRLWRVETVLSLASLQLRRTTLKRLANQDKNGRR